ncbi:actin-related protein Arp6 [Mycena olivaceomarginata]|nr:actin-related protein Arp6 [Mycena olivaceomarginata]
MVVLVLDNGACAIKAGLSDQSSAGAPRIIANAVVRSKGDKTTYIGHELDRCKDYSPIQGYVVDWDAQKAVWDGVLSDEVLNVNPTESTILMTEPYFNLPKIQEVYDQFIFEEYEFQAHLRSTPASLIPHGTLFDQPGLSSPECVLIVDSGFSFTHVVPLMVGKVVWSAVKTRRLDVGGKLLTNQLKELETCCFVTQDFKKELEICRSDPKRNSIVQEYVLPDLTKSKAGRIRQPDDIPLDTDQVLTMGNERFSVPEIIFRPDDIGLEQSGLPSTIAASIGLLPDDLQGMLSELQSLAPVGCEVIIYQSADPALDAYHAAMACAATPAFPDLVVTRAEYLESGSVADAKDKRTQDTATAKGKGKQREREEPAVGLRTRIRAVNPVAPARKPR